MAKICARVVRIIGNFADEHNLGHVVSNDSGVVEPPRHGAGGDVAFYSYSRVPPGPFPRLPPGGAGTGLRGAFPPTAGPAW